VPYNVLKSSRGFTYIGALVLIVILGIMLGAASQSWTMTMKRERETELLFRGAQIKDAIENWYKPVAGRQPTPLRDLKDLLLDPNSLSKNKYLRRDPAKEYNDPVTGKEWKIIRDPTLGIIGVASTSDEEPLKQDFTDYPKDSTEFKMFKAKKKYSEWLFVPVAYQGRVTSLNVTGGSLPIPGSTTGGSPAAGSTTPGSVPQGSTISGR
jgi:type II secretory pathway pseudopilin PulG